MTFRRLVRVRQLRDGLRRRRRIRGRDLLLLHEEGRTWVVEDRCPHLGARLYRGHYDEGQLWCPRHGFCFALDTGHRVSPPDTGAARDRLACYEVLERDGWLGVELP